MRQYVHEAYYLDSGESFGTIVTKKAFKNAMLKHYFEQESAQRVAFSLKGSSNTSHYEVIPYINRSGNQDLLFVGVKNESIS